MRMASETSQRIQIFERGICKQWDCKNEIVVVGSSVVSSELMNEWKEAVYDIYLGVVIIVIISVVINLSKRIEKHVVNTSRITVRVPIRQRGLRFRAACGPPRAREKIVQNSTVQGQGCETRTDQFPSHECI